MILKPKVLAVAAVAVIVVGGVAMRNSGHPYTLTVMMATADGVINGSPVTIGGDAVGTVSGISVQGNAARLTLSLDGSRVPLHAGTQARIDWSSVLGHREIELVPGPLKNPVLPSGQLLPNSVQRVELSDILNTLDGPTRTKVHQLVASLDTALQGNANDLNKTLKAAGPFVQALGHVLQSVGSDQPAINSLVTRLNDMATVLSSRNANMSGTVVALSNVVNSLAAHEKQLDQTIADLPSTVATATKFFNDVPGAVNAAVPLLQQLRPTVDQLPSVAAQLNPVLTSLKPTVHDLKPTLIAAEALLGKTPQLLTIGTATVPEVNTALTQLQPAVAFLRPYTPELVGFLTNWASLFSAKNAAGHFGRAMVPVSASMLNDNPGFVPPGMTQWQTPLPGQLVGQPWTDANGDTVR